MENLIDTNVFKGLTEATEHKGETQSFRGEVNSTQLHYLIIIYGPC